MPFANNTPTSEIRELRPDESDEFISLMVLAFKDSIEKDRLDLVEVRKLMAKVRSPAYKFLSKAVGLKLEFYVAEVESTIASGILLNIDKNEVYVGNLMTHPMYQRQGLARKLLRFSFRRATEMGLKKVTLGARADNVNAIRLYTSEGFETTNHVIRFESDIALMRSRDTRDDLGIQRITKVDFQDIGPMLDDCYPASHLESLGRKKFVKSHIPSRVTRFIAGRLGGQSINTYAFHLAGEERPRGFIQATQSRIDDRIHLSSPILSENDNDLLLEIIPEVLELESSYRGLTAASINCSMHRLDAISKIERLGFKKARESVSMMKKL
ncbi:MAG: GNAT family N-acetyltransferase [Promethearchaeota archaeon]